MNFVGADNGIEECGRRGDGRGATEDAAAAPPPPVRAISAGARARIAWSSPRVWRSKMTGALWGCADVVAGPAAAIGRPIVVVEGGGTDRSMRREGLAAKVWVFGAARGAGDVVAEGARTMAGMLGHQGRGGGWAAVSDGVDANASGDPANK